MVHNYENLYRLPGLSFLVLTAVVYYRRSTLLFMYRNPFLSEFFYGAQKCSKIHSRNLGLTHLSSKYTSQKADAN